MHIDYFLRKLNFQFCFRYEGEVTGSCAWSETAIININFTHQAHKNLKFKYKTIHFSTAYVHFSTVLFC